MVWRAAILLALMLPMPAIAQDASAVSSSEPPAPISTTLSDADLERAVRAAYSGAAAFAAAHGNYFARDGVFEPLRDAVSTELLEEGFGAVAVPGEPMADFDAARACLAAPGAALRIVTNLYGDGLDLVAVTDGRDFAYRYDPRTAAEVTIIAAEACRRAN